VKEFKSGERSPVTNFFLLPNEIIEFTQKKQLYFQKINEGLLFFREVRDFYYLYFYLTDLSHHQAAPTFDLPSLDKFFVTDLVFVERTAALRLPPIEKVLKGNRFQFYKKYIQMSLDPSMNRSEPDLPETKKNPVIDYAKPEEHAMIQRLWQQNLDKFSTALPGNEDLIESIKEKKVIVIRQGECISALMVFTENGKTGFISHVVVAEEYRRKGLAKTMLRLCVDRNSGINRYLLWVAENNTPAFTLYSDFGFQATGKVSYQFLYK
jgi:ribosomal protein S18 acetylase RimI-like enzyme